MCISRHRASCLQPLQRAVHHLQLQSHCCPARTAGPCSLRGFSSLCAVQQHGILSKMPIACWQPDRRCTALPARCCRPGAGCQHQPTGQQAPSLLPDTDQCQRSAAGVAPAARSAHVAAAYKGRYLVVFGGGSVAHCFNDLHVLDTETMEWSQPPLEGDHPSARAGELVHTLQLPTPAAHTTCPCRRRFWCPGTS